MKTGKKHYKNFSQRANPNRGFLTPDPLCLPVNAPGFFFGETEASRSDAYIGMPQGTDGNILVMGGNGSGKSSGIVKPTLETWQGAICATDIKGELSEHYAKWCQYATQHGIPTRPHIIFDPTRPGGVSYDPFGWLALDDEVNRVDNVNDIVQAIIPEIPNDCHPFWIQAERLVLETALLYYSRLGLSFNESICTLLTTGVSALSLELHRNGCEEEKLLLGNLEPMNSETLTSIEFSLRGHLHPFATNPHIRHGFRGARENAVCFHWNDLERKNIFLRVPQDKIGLWGSAINLMYAQLLRYLERRAERYSGEGQNTVQTLLLMDEFPRFGKLEPIPDALATLRSKGVNICLIVQSTAQLDQLYGTAGRRILMDNCQYQAILRANDAETQDILCRLIGSTQVVQESVSQNVTASGHKVGYSSHRSIGREPKVFPHELALLNDIILLSPHGSSLVKKHLPHGNSAR